jgi:hypothetical protein
MMKKANRWMALVALSGMMAACYGGGEAPAPAPEEEVGEAEAALSCQSECQQMLWECTWSCPPDDPWLPSNPCVDQCYEFYGYCLDGC